MPSRTFQEPTRKWVCARGYAIEKDGNEELVEHLRKKLTVKPRVINGEANEFPVFMESNRCLYIPKAFGLHTFGCPSVNTLHDGDDAPNLVFNGSPRPEQKEPIDKFVDAANDPIRGGGLLVLPCGFGKTVCALYISTVFRKKTLIICHKGFLMDQWRERIEQYIPTAKVGLIKQSKVDVENKDIVIASLQSLAMRNYDPCIFKTFGLVIIDEVHHTSAEVFSRALARIVCKRTLGLSATPDRKDGLRKVFEWFIGKPVYEIRKRGDNQLQVMLKKFYDPNPAYGRELHMYNGKLNVAQMINAICSFEPRNQLIIDTLKEVKEQDPGRQVIILSERRKHLETLKYLIKTHNLGTSGYYVGGMSQEDLKKSESKDFILATYHIAAEGFDVPSLNTLVLASPVSSIEQPVGRIQRQKPHERKYVPLVIDIWDEFSIFRNQGFRRIQFYKKNGYSINGSPDECEDAEIKQPEKKYTFVRDEDDDI
jgi:superfamily II DNA or RNA helicase